MQCIVDQLLITYTDEGSGKILVLLHGWGTSATDLQCIATPLARTYRVINVDLPGFGGSQVPPKTWGVGEYAKFVDSFLGKLSIKSVYCLIGHSHGGRIAIKGCAEAILQPKRVVLIGAAGIKHSRDAKSIGYTIAAKSGKVIFSMPFISRFAEQARKRLYSSAGSDDYLQAGPMRSVFSNVIKEDLQEYAAKISQPTLLIWGQYDNQSTIDDARIFESLIKNSKLEIIPKSGHFVHNEATDRVVKLIEEFLS